MAFDRTFFITTVTWQRTPLFRNPQKAELMMDVLAHYREQKKYVLHEFVIMPDHLHLLLTPAAGAAGGKPGVVSVFVGINEIPRSYHHCDLKLMIHACSSVEERPFMVASRTRRLKF